MPTKIRLQRRGKKGQPFYHIVIADGRAPRDGRFIENIGIYNPLTKPATIDIQFDKALDWLRKGAQPTDTARAILGYTGVLYKYHLLKGLKKGALTEEQVEMKFQAWKNEKDEKISRARKEQELKVKESRKKSLSEEAKVNEAKAQEVARKLAKAAEAKAAQAEAAEGVVTETAEDTVSGAVEGPVQEPATETPAAEAEA